MNTPVELLLSRNFVEFGPFTAEEIATFAGRGLLRDTDFVKAADGAWQPYCEWLAGSTEPKPEDAKSETAPAKTPAKKKTAKSKTAA